MIRARFVVQTGFHQDLSQLSIIWLGLPAWFRRWYRKEEEGQGGLYGPRSGSHGFETVMADVVGYGARAGILFFPV